MLSLFVGGESEAQDATLCSLAMQLPLLHQHATNLVRKQLSSSIAAEAHTDEVGWEPLVASAES